MKASEIKFEEFLNKKKTNFIIPVYQRNYDWKDTQCREFIIAEKYGLEDDDIIFYIS